MLNVGLPTSILFLKHNKKISNCNQSIESKKMNFRGCFTLSIIFFFIFVPILRAEQWKNYVVFEYEGQSIPLNSDKGQVIWNNILGNEQKFGSIKRSLERNAGYCAQSPRNNCEKGLGESTNPQWRSDIFFVNAIVDAFFHLQTVTYDGEKYQHIDFYSDQTEKEYIYDLMDNCALYIGNDFKTLSMSKTFEFGKPDYDKYLNNNIYQKSSACRKLFEQRLISIKSIKAHFAQKEKEKEEKKRIAQRKRFEKIQDLMTVVVIDEGKSKNLKFSNLINSDLYRQGLDLAEKCIDKNQNACAQFEETLPVMQRQAQVFFEKEKVRKEEEQRRKEEETRQKLIAEQKAEQEKKLLEFKEGIIIGLVQTDESLGVILPKCKRFLSSSQKKALSKCKKNISNKRFDFLNSKILMQEALPEWGMNDEQYQIYINDIFDEIEDRMSQKRYDDLEMLSMVTMMLTMFETQWDFHPTSKKREFCNKQVQNAGLSCQKIIKCFPPKADTKDFCLR